MDSEEIRRFRVFGAATVLHHGVLEHLDSENGDTQQLGRILRLRPFAELDKGHDIAAICPARVIGFCAG